MTVFSMIMDSGFQAVWRTIADIPYWWRTCHYLDLGSAPDWMKQIFNQLEVLARTG